VKGAGAGDLPGPWSLSAGQGVQIRVAITPSIIRAHQQAKDIRRELFISREGGKRINGVVAPKSTSGIPIAIQ